MAQHNLSTVISFEVVRTLTKRRFWISTLIVPVIGAIVIALIVLSNIIIAYRQPVTAPEIEAVRGVSVSGVVKTLLERRLISEAGRKATLGRPMLYITSQDFLHYFALADLTQLPPLEADMPALAPVPAKIVTDGPPQIIPD